MSDLEEYEWPATQDPFLMDLSSEQLKLHLKRPSPPLKRKAPPAELPRKKINKYNGTTKCDGASTLFVRDPNTKTLLKTSTIDEFVEHWKVFQQAMENVSHLNV